VEGGGCGWVCAVLLCVSCHVYLFILTRGKTKKSHHQYALCLRIVCVKQRERESVCMCAWVCGVFVCVFHVD